MYKTNNVYLVLTEYQFLQALNIATSVYNSSNFENIIYVVRDGRRLKALDENKELKIDNIQIRILDHKSPKELAIIILREKPNHFLFFQAISAVNIYLGDKLSKKRVEISLGPDGYGTYAIYNLRFPFLSFLKNTLKENIYLFKNKLFNSKILPFDYYSYGHNKFIDNLWITHPDQYVHRAKNKVNILKLPDFNEKCLDFIKYCFDFNESFPTKNVIYYFNQPLWDELIDKEFDFLNEVVNEFPSSEIVVKLHPLTSDETKYKYQNIENLRIIESSVPAEVILLNIENCIVFTGWSSVLITENKTCNYYFNYPIYKDIQHKLLDQSNLIILDHIKTVNSPNEMRFPNG